MKPIYLILLLIPLAFACEKDSTIEIPNSEPMLVAAQFVGQTDDTLRLKLSWTRPIYNNNSTSEILTAQNAAVYVTINGSNIPLTYNAYYKEYSAKAPLLSVKDKLQLAVNCEGKTIQSSCIIPEEPNYNMKYNGFKITSSDGWGDDKVYSYTFTNLSSEKTSYYRLIFSGYYKYHGKTNKQELYQKRVDCYMLRPNESISIEATSSIYEETEIDSIRYYVIRSDEHYYKYHTSVWKYQGEDFFTEPSIIYSNIEGGIGVFSAFTMKSDTTILR